MSLICTMSFNVTTGNPHNLRKGNILMTDLNDAKKEEQNRRRLMRLEQVRQQSKDIANHVRQRVKHEKVHQLKTFTKMQEADLRSWQEKKLTLLQKNYHECLDEVGLAHTHAALQPDPVSVLAAEVEKIQKDAKIRGQMAAAEICQEQDRKKETEENIKRQKQYVRSVENSRALHLIRTGKLRSQKKPLGEISQNVITNKVLQTLPSTTESARESYCKSYVCGTDRSEDCASISMKEATFSDGFSSGLSRHTKMAIFTELPPVNAVQEKLAEHVSSTRLKLNKLVKKSKYNHRISPIVSESECSTKLKSNSTVCEAMSAETRTENRLQPIFTGPTPKQSSLLKYEKVHFYDHSSRYQQHYSCPEDLIYKADYREQLNAAEIAQQETTLAETLKAQENAKKEAYERVKLERGQKAMEVERGRRQYYNLLKDLAALSREERLIRGSNISTLPPEIYQDDERRRERETARQKNMDSVFENVYYRTTTKSIGNAPSATNEWLNSTVNHNTSSKLNVAQGLIFKNGKSSCEANTKYPDPTSPSHESVIISPGNFLGHVTVNQRLDPESPADESIIISRVPSPVTNSASVTDERARLQNLLDHVCKQRQLLFEKNCNERSEVEKSSDHEKFKPNSQPVEENLVFESESIYQSSRDEIPKDDDLLKAIEVQNIDKNQKDNDVKNESKKPEIDCSYVEKSISNSSLLCACNKSHTLEICSISGHSSNSSRNSITSYEGVKIFLKVSENSQHDTVKLHSNAHNHKDANKIERPQHLPSGMHKYCRKHCRKKETQHNTLEKAIQVEYNLKRPGNERDPQTKEKGVQVETKANDVGNEYDLDELGELNKSDPYNADLANDVATGTSWHDRLLRKNNEISFNAVSASTSYMSPPEKISSSHVAEMQAVINKINKKFGGEHFNYSFPPSEKNNILHHYIQKLLTMNKNNVDALNVSVSDVSTPSSNIITSSRNINDSVEQNIVDSFIETRERTDAEKQVIQEGPINLSSPAESHCSKILKNGDKCDCILTPCSDNYEVITLVNKRINETLDNIENRILHDTKPVPDEILQEDELPDAEYTKLANKCSQRISDLCEKINSIRKEKQIILDSSSGSSSGKTVNQQFESTVYISPPASAHVSVNISEILHVDRGRFSQPLLEESVKSVLNIKQTQAPSQVPERSKPPVSSLRNVVRSVIPSMPAHELSTIVEVDSPQPSNIQKSLSETPHYRQLDKSEDEKLEGATNDDKQEEVNAREDNSSSSSTSFPDIIGELIRRKVLTSPLEWMIDNDNGKQRDTEKHLSDFSTSTNNASADLNKVVYIDSPSASTKTPVRSPDSTLDSSPEGLQEAFNKLGFRWASTMIRKTQEAMACNSSSSDSSPNVDLNKSHKSIILKINTSQRNGIGGHSTPVPSDCRQDNLIHNVNNFTLTGESEVSVIGQESLDELSITAPNVSLVSKSNKRNGSMNDKSSSSH